jgi:hypothetical protein
MGRDTCGAPQPKAEPSFLNSGQARSLRSHVRVVRTGRGSAIPRLSNWPSRHSLLVAVTPTCSCERSIQVPKT